ncbi:MAG: hypothetical protein GY838_11430 [bacterium]|nr:hypothetical protein [bacterium]
MTRNRLSVVLLVVMVAAVVAAFVVLRSRDDGEHVLGGPLFTLDLAEVKTVTVIRDGQQFRLERHRDSAWTLGGALADWVDPYALGRSLVKLDGAIGGTVLAGSEPEDRRYEFNGPQGLRLTMTTADGQQVGLALGATNPVTGHVYASGAGRTASFPVAPDTRELIAALPQNSRLMKVLPHVVPADLDRIELDRGGRRDVFVRDGSDWWLAIAGPQDTRLPEPVRAYAAHYGDKTRTVDGGFQVLAERRLIAELVLSVTGTNVANLVEPAEAAGYRSAWGLDDPWQRVALHGPGLDPDPLSETPDLLTVAFGLPLDRDLVPALRRGNPLLVKRQAIAWLEPPPGELLDLRALELHPLRADTVTLSGQAGVLARAARNRDRDVRFDGRLQWDSLLATGGDEHAHAAVRSMVVGLDRLPILATLAPSDDPSVLRNDERLRLTVVGVDPAPSQEWHLGWLAVDRVAGGTASLVQEEGIEGRAGLWNPRDGRLVQVPSWILLTGRSLSH